MKNFFWKSFATTGVIKTFQINLSCLVTEKRDFYKFGQNKGSGLDAGAKSLQKLYTLHVLIYKYLKNTFLGNRFYIKS